MANEQQHSSAVLGIGEPIHETVTGRGGPSFEHHGTQRFYPLEKFETLDQLNDAFVQKLVRSAQRRLRDLKCTEAEALSAINDRRGEYERAYQNFFARFGEDASPREIEDKWKKVRQQAVGAFYESPYEEAQPARVAGTPEEPAMPAPPPPPQVAEQAQVTQEHLEDIMSKVDWDSWGGPNAVYSNELLETFCEAFVPELQEAFWRLSDNPETREIEMNHIKSIYQGKLFGFYMNQYPGKKGSSQEREYLENIQSWLDERWNEVLLEAEKS